MRKLYTYRWASNEVHVSIEAMHPGQGTKIKIVHQIPVLLVSVTFTDAYSNSVYLSCRPKAFT